jgi:hypothetical protein
MCEYVLESLKPWYDYIRHPDLLPVGSDGSALAAKFFVLDTIRRAVASGLFATLAPENKPTPEQVNGFLFALRKEDRVVLLLDQVPQWAALGADSVLADTFEDLVENLP